MRPFSSIPLPTASVLFAVAAERERQNAGVRPCTVGGCSRPYRARGYCASHYQRAIEAGTLAIVLPRNPTNTCPKCKERQRKRGRPYCNPCHAEDVKARHAKDPDRGRFLRKARYNPGKRRIAMLAKYGLTPVAYAALLAKQDGRCAICRAVGELHVDHDHSCCPGKLRSCGKCVRGLLCPNCNNGIGRFGDDPRRLRAAADYVAVAWAETLP